MLTRLDWYGVIVEEQAVVHESQQKNGSLSLKTCMMCELCKNMLLKLRDNAMTCEQNTWCKMLFALISYLREYHFIMSACWYDSRKFEYIVIKRQHKWL